MADAKIKIIVNANDAINNLNELQKEVDFTQKSFSKLANKNGGFDDDSFRQVTGLINYRANVMKELIPGYEGVQKAASYVNSQMLKLNENYALNSDQIERLGILNTSWADTLSETSNETQKAERVAKSFGNTLEKEAKSGLQAYGVKLFEIFKNIMGFQLIIATGRKTMTAISNFFKESAKAAAQAEQVYNKLSTVFENFSDSANKSAKALASTLGVSKSTAASALSTIGDLLQAQGMGVAQSLETASSWAKQLQDIIAFKDLNMSLEEFAQTFMSGAAGNLRNFRTFGSIVKESAVNAELAKKGYDKLTGSELELAKMTTRAELALKQQANAIGATEREWETMLSINRRLEEAQKQFKENTGEAINELLTPWKKLWTTVLEDINKANASYKEFLEKNGYSGTVYDINNNKRDYNKFRNDIMQFLQPQFADLAYYGSPAFDETKNKELLVTLQNVNLVMSEYGATVKQVKDVLGGAISDIGYQWLKEQEEQRKATIENTKALEKSIAEVGVIDDSYQSFYERLASITGVTDLTRFNFKYNGLGTEATAAAEQRLRGLNIRQALESIIATPLQKFGDTISTALDEQSEEELLGLKAEALKSVFTEAWNDAVKNGEDPLANEQVLYAKEQYKATIQQIEILEAQKEAADELKKTIDDNNKNIEQSMQVLVSKINPFASTLSAYEQGSTAFGTVDETTGEIIGNTLGGILGILADIASQTEAFSELSSLVADYIVPVFDAVLKPILPTIKLIGNLLQSVLLPLISFVFPILQTISIVVTGILGAVGTLIDGVQAIVNFFGGRMSNPISDALGRTLESYGLDTSGNSWNKAMRLIGYIADMQLVIADNTDPTKSDLFKAYDEMFNQKMINASEYQSLLGSINGLKYDRLQTWDNGTYRNGSGGTTVVYSGGISFTVNGTNLSSEEIFREFERWLARQQMGGARVYG